MKTKGWKNVFSFTFVQQIKTKSFIISTVVISIIVALISATANILPLVLLSNQIEKIESSAGENNEITISKLYLYDEAETGLNLNTVPEELGIACEIITDHDAAVAKNSELENTGANEMLTMISKGEPGFVVISKYAGVNSTIASNDADNVTALISKELINRYCTTTLGISEDQAATVLAPVATEVIRAGVEPVGMIQSLINTVVPMISSIILFIFIFSYSQLVAQSVAIEKSSRIMEYLLTSIKPLAIIIGKVLAMCTVSLMQFIIIIFGGTAGFIISLPFGIFTKIDSLVATASQTGVANEAQGILTDIQGAFSTFNASSIIVMILTFILGFLFFALIAGLAGASISKMEDLSAAIQPMSLIGVLGFYLAYFPQIGAMESEENSMMVLARFLPISSPFILPSDYMLGKIDIGTAMLSLLVLLAAVVVMAMIVAKVYEHIVLHTGNRLTLKDMLNMAK